MIREEVRERIREIGIVPAIRVSTAEDAYFAAEAVTLGGIPIVEVTMTVPDAMKVISALIRNYPELIVGAGTVLEIELARECRDAGVQFLTSTGLDLDIVDFAVKENIVVLAGAMTPTEIMRAWKAGADFVKVFPCSQVGGPSYIRTLKAPFPHISLIASGGVNQQNASDFIRAGSSALGIGHDLIPQIAIERHQDHRIRELARRYASIVKTARAILESNQIEAHPHGPDGD
jgi:2-dehydro-3-deoxyphosphogluconate aldolase/(4S)-4-hydroxy-2-oxoglutarate aldolase